MTRGPGGRSRVVSGPAPFGLYSLGGPGHHVERIDAADRVGAPLGHDVGNPGGSIS